MPLSTPARSRPSSDLDARFAREAMPWLEHVYRFALVLTGDQGAATELTERTFVCARLHWGDPPPRQCEDPRVGLLGMCRNLFTESMASSTEPLDPTSPAANPSIDVLGTGRVFATVLRDGLGDLWSSEESWNALAPALGRLPEPCRSALVLIDVEALSYESVAALLGASTDAVRTWLFRGRRTLQELLLERVSRHRSESGPQHTTPNEEGA